LKRSGAFRLGEEFFWGASGASLVVMLCIQECKKGSPSLVTASWFKGRK
jgi:hypothetical protein